MPCALQNNRKFKLAQTLQRGPFSEVKFGERPIVAHASRLCVSRWVVISCRVILDGRHICCSEGSSFECLSHRCANSSVVCMNIEHVRAGDIFARLPTFVSHDYPDWHNARSANSWLTNWAAKIKAV